MSDQAINAALAARLQALGLPTAFENAKFTPTAGVLYLEENYLPGETTSVGVASTSSDVFTGIYQVTVLAPLDGTKGPGMATAKQVAEHFPKGMRLTHASGLKVTILRASQGPGFKRNDRWAIPVSIRYRSFA